MYCIHRSYQTYTFSYLYRHHNYDPLLTASNNIQTILTTVKNRKNLTVFMPIGQNYEEQVHSTPSAQTGGLPTKAEVSVLADFADLEDSPSGVRLAEEEDERLLYSGRKGCVSMCNTVCTLL